MSTPASASSSNVKEEKPDPTLAELVRKYDTEKLIEFLKEQEDLQLNDAHFEILPRLLVVIFLLCARNCGLKFGHATRLVEIAEKRKAKN